MDAREVRGLELALRFADRIVERDGYWLFPSQFDDGVMYEVRLLPSPECQCPDFTERQRLAPGEKIAQCKHLAGLRFVLAMRLANSGKAVAEMMHELIRLWEVNSASTAAHESLVIKRIAQSQDTLLRAMESFRGVTGVESDYLTIKQAARRSSFSPSHVRAEIMAGRIVALDMGTPSRPLYRIPVDELKKWLARGTKRTVSSDVMQKLIDEHFPKNRRNTR